VSLSLVRAAAELEARDDLHLGRLLVLVRALTRSGGTVDGITKLVKLDFLLRYPNCLERALVQTGADAGAAGVTPRERQTVEAKMIRYRYGPWDSRYRRWLALLEAKGLVAVSLRGRTVHVAMTLLGATASDEIAATPAFREISARSSLLNSHFGRMPPSRLKNFVYATFPEIASLQLGEEIAL
jgi:hypothetical protein